MIFRDLNKIWSNCRNEDLTSTKIFVFENRSFRIIEVTAQMLK